VKDGRFFVKRNRGNQEGYLVLAPFTVNQKIKGPSENIEPQKIKT
jgi:hypothetical protein